MTLLEVLVGPDGNSCCLPDPRLKRIEAGGRGIGIHFPHGLFQGVESRHEIRLPFEDVLIALQSGQFQPLPLILQHGKHTLLHLALLQLRLEPGDVLVAEVEV